MSSKAVISLVLGLSLFVVSPTRVFAHDAERTQVTLNVSRDGSFVLDVANDPNWLLLRLERFAGCGSRVPLSTSTNDPRCTGPRDARLAAMAPGFVDRIVLFMSFSGA